MVSGGVSESVHDLTIIQNCGLLSKLLSGEFILADKAYIGKNCFIHLIKPAITVEEKEFNSTISNIHETVEHTI